MQKKVLLIGAGAVGMVYGKHLAEGGFKITFYVRSKYLDELKEGVHLYHINKDKHLKNPILFKDFDLVSSFDEVKAKNWDQVYLCISSTALQAFDLHGLKQSLPNDPTIVMLQPSAQDYNTLVKVFPKGQIVEGMITLISYMAPLSTEAANPSGIAYYLPPKMSTPFSGSQNRRDDVIETFTKSNLSAKASDSVLLESLFPTAFLMTFLTALESSSWKFDKLKSDKALLKKLNLVANEIFAALESKHNVRRPMPLRFISSPRMVKTMLTLAPKVMPMDIETYLKYHFLKVKDQTKLYMNNYLNLAQELKLPSENIEDFCKLT